MTSDKIIQPFPPPTAVSLFSGCGGFCEGIDSAGFNILVAVENDHYACDTYRFNFETPLFADDVRIFLSGSNRSHTVEYGLQDVDLLFGGPPCQGYSQIGTRSLGDHRNDLYQEYVRVLTELKPKVFLMENVPNMLLMNKGHYRDLILNALRSAGYSNTTYVQVMASEYGVPQDRKRVFFVGTHDRFDLNFDLCSFVMNSLANIRVKQPVTVWEAIGDLPCNVVASGETMPYPNEYTSCFQQSMRLDCDSMTYSIADKFRRGIRRSGKICLHNHHTKEIQQRRLNLISMLEAGKKANSLPKEIWNGARPEKWRRLHPDRPAYTLLANMHRDMSEFVHPVLNRWITVREAARLQSFHDGFVFVGSEWQQLKQIGNAVPPLMGQAIGLVARNLLERIYKRPEQSRTTSSQVLAQVLLPF